MRRHPTTQRCEASALSSRGPRRYHPCSRAGVSNFRGMAYPVAKNVSITFATSLLSSGATAVGALVVANALGARGAGLFTLARVVPTVVASVLGAGITIATPYFIGGRRHSVQAIAETNVLLGLVFGLMGLGAWILGAPLLMTHF